MVYVVAMKTHVTMMGKAVVNMPKKIMTVTETVQQVKTVMVTVVAAQLKMNAVYVEVMALMI